MFYSGPEERQAGNFYIQNRRTTARNVLYLDQINNSSECVLYGQVEQQLEMCSIWTRITIAWNLFYSDQRNISLYFVLFGLEEQQPGMFFIETGGKARHLIYPN